MRRATAILAHAFAIALSVAPAVPAVAVPQSAGADAPKPKDPPPVAPASLPSGATLPPALPAPRIRPDAFVTRVIALENVAKCPECKGSGTKVSRVREKGGHLGAPAKVREVGEECPDCKGLGCRADAERLASALDALVESLAGFQPGNAAAEKHLERAHRALLRLAGAPLVARSVCAQDRNSVSSGRQLSPGTAMTLVGTVGKPIALPGGGRLLTVGTGAHSAVVLRDPALNDSPESGEVVVGGLFAGAIGGVEWDWGMVPVIDRGFVVPLKPGAAQGPVDPSPAAPAGNAGSPSSSSASPIP